MNEEIKQEDGLIIKLMEVLDGILCSYKGYGNGSAYVDMDSFVLFASLVMQKKVKIERYQYLFDDDIYADELAVRIYQNLAPQTRWRVGCHTQIEPIRMNALKQLAPMGKPVYQGRIYYPDAKAMLECGEILPYDIFHLFTDMPDLKTVYVFPYPFKDEEGKSSYYSFEPSETAKMEMREYADRIFQKMRDIVEKSGF